jgi:hypothetical protein
LVGLLVTGDDAETPFASSGGVRVIGASKSRARAIGALPACCVRA